VWESDEEGEAAWERLPLWARKQIIDKKIRVFTLPGFKIAREATDRGDLQLRMQGNAFLGAFFSVSPMLGEFGITPEQFRDAVHKQYVKKFGKLGDAVVSSNMEVMTKGFELVREIKVGELEAADRSSLRGKALLPVVMPETLAAVEGSCGTGCRTIPPPPEPGLFFSGVAKMALVFCYAIGTLSMTLKNSSLARAEKPFTSCVTLRMKSCGFGASSLLEIAARIISRVRLLISGSRFSMFCRSPASLT
jgi:hypothetical protein